MRAPSLRIEGRPRHADHWLPLEPNCQREKLNPLVAASVITARGEPHLLLLPVRADSPNAQTLRRVPDIAPKPQTSGSGAGSQIPREKNRGTPPQVPALVRRDVTRIGDIPMLKVL